MAMSAARAGLIITQGGTYTFPIGNTDSKAAAVVIMTEQPVNLIGCNIFSYGDGIVSGIDGVQLYVSHCNISILGPDGTGNTNSNGHGVVIYKGAQLIVDHCSINDGLNGIYFCLALG